MNPPPLVGDDGADQQGFFRISSLAVREATLHHGNRQGAFRVGLQTEDVHPVQLRTVGKVEFRLEHRATGPGQQSPMEHRNGGALQVGLRIHQRKEIEAGNRRMAKTGTRRKGIDGCRRRRLRPPVFRGRRSAGERPVDVSRGGPAGRVLSVRIHARPSGVHRRSGQEAHDRGREGGKGAFHVVAPMAGRGCHCR